MPFTFHAQEGKDHLVSASRSWGFGICTRFSIKNYIGHVRSVRAAERDVAFGTRQPQGGAHSGRKNCRPMSAAAPAKED